MRRYLHLLLLRGASLLVRRPERQEWFAEWNAELVYVRSRSRTSFCLGAFRDAFWVRRHSPASVRLQSPWECLGLLALFAMLSVFFALRMPLPHEMFFSHTLPDGLVTVSGISIDQYRGFPSGHSNAAFYAIPHRPAHPVPVALATANLFTVLHVPLAATVDNAWPAVLTLTAWRRDFGSDPRIVGRRMILAGRPAQVAAVVSDRVWSLPGRVEAWLLVDDAGLPPDSFGYVVARLHPGTRSVAIPRADGGADRFFCIPFDEPHVLVLCLLMMGVSLLILPAVTSLSVADCPGNPRCWTFLLAKVLLVVPIVLFGSADVFSLFAAALQPHAMIVGSVIGFRWILLDQRSRCPVCLRVLSSPIAIGEPSRTLLEWYGTELVCSRGHGLLHVPEIRTSYSQQRWLQLDSSWSSLF